MEYEQILKGSQFIYMHEIIVYFITDLISQ